MSENKLHIRIRSQKPIPDKPQDTYKVVLYFGGGSYVPSREVLIPADSPYLMPFMEDLKDCTRKSRRFSDREEGDKQITSHPFYRWSMRKDNPSFHEGSVSITFFWPSDPEVGFDFHLSLSHFDLTYFDVGGVEYEAELEYI